MKILKDLILLVIALLYIINSGNAQENFYQREFGIGDTIPDIVIQNIINNEFKEKRVSELYKNGLLIIDFWATWCVPCLEQLRNIDTLKKHFNKRFQTVSTTYQDSIEVGRFLSTSAKRNIGTDRTIIATNDSVWRFFFPHRDIPHNVWVDSTGVVRYITGHNELNKVNVENFLAGRKIEGVSIKQEILDFDYTEDFQLGNNNFLFRSLITPYVHGINGGMILQKESPEVCTRFFAWNTTVTQLYWAAYSMTLNSGYDSYLRESLVEIKAKDSIRYFFPTREYSHLLKKSRYNKINEWRIDNLFCYELNLKKGVTEKELSNYMFSDLDKVFDVTAKIEKRKIPCYNVSILKRNKLPASKYKETVFRMRDSTLVAQNITISDFFYQLFLRQSQNKHPFVISDLGDFADYRFDLSIDLSDSKNDNRLAEITSYLNKYGVKVELKNTDYPILVISEK